MSVQACLEKLNQQKAQPTPLTGKSYVISGDQFCPVTPISGAVYNANKLANLLNDDWRGPTPELDRIMRSVDCNALFTRMCRSRRRYAFFKYI